MAHIQKRNGRYQARYRDPSGKERTKTFTRKVDAEAFLHDVEVRKRTGEWVSPQRAATRTADWAERWLATKHSLKPKTLTGYESLLRVHVLSRFGDWRLNAIEPTDVETWVGDLVATGLSASRIRQAHHVLSSMLEAAVRNRYLPNNPARGAELPRATLRDIRVISAWELDRLADAVRPEYRSLVLFLGYTGVRWGEAAALRAGRLHLPWRRAEIAESVTQIGTELVWGRPKSHRIRTVVFPDFLTEMLEAATRESGPSDLVWTSVTGRPIRHSLWTRQIWKPAVREAALDGLRIHDLRHCAASLMIGAGASIEAVRVQLGHRSADITLRVYSHLLADHAESVADALNHVYENAREKPHRRIAVVGGDPNATKVVER